MGEMIMPGGWTMSMMWMRMPGQSWPGAAAACLGMGVVIAIMLLMRLVTATPAGVDDDGLVEVVIRPSGALLAQSGTAIIDAWSYPDYLDIRDATSGKESYELGRYLDYCSEMLSLTGKVAVLYVQDFDDDVALAGVTEVENLTNGLSRKIWQKLMVLNADPQAREPGGSEPVE